MYKRKESEEKTERKRTRKIGTIKNVCLCIVLLAICLFLAINIILFAYVNGQNSTEITLVSLFGIIISVWVGLNIYNIISKEQLNDLENNVEELQTSINEFSEEVHLLLELKKTYFELVKQQIVEQGNFMYYEYIVNIIDDMHIETDSILLLSYISRMESCFNQIRILRRDKQVDKENLYQIGESVYNAAIEKMDGYLINIKDKNKKNIVKRTIEWYFGFKLIDIYWYTKYTADGLVYDQYKKRFLDIIRKTELLIFGEVYAENREKTDEFKEHVEFIKKKFRERETNDYTYRSRELLIAYILNLTAEFIREDMRANKKLDRVKIEGIEKDVEIMFEYIRTIMGKNEKFISSKAYSQVLRNYANLFVTQMRRDSQGEKQPCFVRFNLAGFLQAELLYIEALRKDPNERNNYFVLISMYNYFFKTEINYDIFSEARDIRNRAFNDMSILYDTLDKMAPQQYVSLGVDISVFLRQVSFEEKNYYFKSLKEGDKEKDLKKALEKQQKKTESQ